MRHRIVSNFVLIGQTVAGIWRFIFFQYGGHPPSWILFWACLDRPRRVFDGRYRCAAFGWNRYRSFDNMHDFRFRSFGLKMPFTLQKLAFWGI